MQGALEPTGEQRETVGVVPSAAVVQARHQLINALAPFEGGRQVPGHLRQRYERARQDLDGHLAVLGSALAGEDWAQRYRQASRQRGLTAAQQLQEIARAARLQTPELDALTRRLENG